MRLGLFRGVVAQQRGGLGVAAGGLQRAPALVVVLVEGLEGQGEIGGAMLLQQGRAVGGVRGAGQRGREGDDEAEQVHGIAGVVKRSGGAMAQSTQARSR